MKISGKDAKPKGELPPLVFARTPMEDSIVFKFQSVPSWVEFEKLCPPPVPGRMLTPKGVADDTEAPGYQEAVKQHDLRRAQYLMLKTLEPSNIEFDNVKFDDVSTWDGLDAELQSVLTKQEFIALVNRVYKANFLSEEMLEAAAEAFFLKADQPA